MPKPLKSPKISPVRLTDETMRLVKIAAGYTGESIAEYVNRVLCVITRDDISRLHALAMKADTTAKKPKAKRAGRGETPGS